MQGHLRNVIKNIQHSADELGKSTHVVADSSNQAQQFNKVSDNEKCNRKAKY